MAASSRARRLARAVDALEDATANAISQSASSQPFIGLGGFALPTEPASLSEEILIRLLDGVALNHVNALSLVEERTLVGDQIVEVLIVRRAQRLEPEVIDDQQRHLDEILELAVISVGGPGGMQRAEQL